MSLDPQAPFKGAGPRGGHGMLARLQRIWALFLRFWYLLRRSPPRFIDLMYWPTLNMLVWGFLNLYLHQQGLQASGVAIGLSLLLGATMLWDIVLRGQLGIMVTVMEEFWSRHLGHLFVSPLRPHEFLLSLVGISVLRSLCGVLPAMLLAIPIFGYSIFTLGWPLAAFIFCLLMSGWWCGLLVASLIFRFGLSAEWLGWMALFLLSPFVCAYYPVTVLPVWLQPVALALPPTHVFEGMRSLLFDGQFRPEQIGAAFGLNLLYLAGASAVFLSSIHGARRRGRLLSFGE